jgi:hypothetical protein
MHIWKYYWNGLQLSNFGCQPDKKAPFTAFSYLAGILSVDQVIINIFYLIKGNANAPQINFHCLSPITLSGHDVLWILQVPSSPSPSPQEKPILFLTGNSAVRIAVQGLNFHHWSSFRVPVCHIQENNSFS